MARSYEYGDVARAVLADADHNARVRKANDIIQEQNKRDWVVKYVTKDSGAREEYDSGMVRDTQEGKADYTLLPREFLKRWAELMTRGAVKYGRDNWRKANSQKELTRFEGSALRHMHQWLDGETDEDHAAAVAFNLAAAEYVKDRMLDQWRGGVPFNQG